MPATTATAGRSFTSDAALEIYTTGLKNAHALEQQATQLLERQLEQHGPAEATVTLHLTDDVYLRCLPELLQLGALAAGDSAAGG